MIANAAFLAALSVFLFAGWLAGELRFLAPYKTVLFHGAAIGGCLISSASPRPTARGSARHRRKCYPTVSATDDAADDRGHSNVRRFKMKVDPRRRRSHPEPGHGNQIIRQNGIKSGFDDRVTHSPATDLPRGSSKRVRG
jgi:hypothetical protein